MRALLIDDETIVREGLALKLKLEDPDIEVTSCGTLEEARKEIEEARPEIVFLDVKLNGDREAGLRFIEELQDKAGRPRVVMLSSETDNQTVTRAIMAGAVGFISKSDQGSSVMRKAINMLLQGGVYISEDARMRPGPPPPPRLTEVGPKELKISAPRVYEALYHLSRGATYKAACRVMDIAPTTVEEYARDGFNILGVRTKSDFLVMLMDKGWKLKDPR